MIEEIPMHEYVTTHSDAFLAAAAVVLMAAAFWFIEGARMRRAEAREEAEWANGAELRALNTAAREALETERRMREARSAAFRMKHIGPWLGRSSENGTDGAYQRDAWRRDLIVGEVVRERTAEQDAAHLALLRSKLIGD